MNFTFNKDANIPFQQSTFSVNKHKFRQYKIQLASHIIFIACFLMWGGIGLFDTANSPEVLGLFKVQDILVFIAGSYLILVATRKKTYPKSFLIIVALLSSLMVLGLLSGFVRGNHIRDIALELRPILYMLLGVLVSSLLHRNFIAKNIFNYTIIVSLVILIQFALYISVGYVFVNGVVPGNANSVNLPVVRPQSFHLVVFGLILAIGYVKKFGAVLLIFTILAALFIMQSKTYWGLAVIGLMVIFFMDKSLPIRNKIWLVALLFGGGIIFSLITMPLVKSFNQDGGFLLTKKITDIFSDNDVAYRVVGVRLDESNLMLNSWMESPTTTMFGQGLGHLYRDMNLFFYRVELRDQQRLAMFGHNYYVWMLLKFGLLGTFMFFSMVFYSLANVTQRSFPQRRRFALGMLVLLAASVFLGVLESPLGGFLFGLLLYATAKPEVFEPSGENVAVKHSIK